MPRTVFQPLAVMFSGLARSDAPALLTMTSRRPRSRTVRSTSAFTASSCRTSMATANDRRPSLAISAVTGSRFSILRLATTTSAPARANSTAIERPMPTPPPVTMAILFSSENGDGTMTSPRLVGWASRGRLYPARGRGAREADAQARRGMDEAEAARVERQAAEGVDAASVLAVARDRVAQIGELHADL